MLALNLSVVQMWKMKPDIIEHIKLMVYAETIGLFLGGVILLSSSVMNSYEQ